MERKGVRIMTELKELIAYWKTYLYQEAQNLNPYNQDIIYRTIAAIEELQKIKGGEQ